jgi:putative membrane protein
MKRMDDPRIYFAAERTLLAWSRTSLAMMGLGFVVARFGLFLQVLKYPAGSFAHHGISLGIGISLVLLGAMVNIVSGFQFIKYFRTLDKSNLPRDYGVYSGLTTAFLLATIGIILAVYLYL